MNQLGIFTFSKAQTNNKFTVIGTLHKPPVTCESIP